MAEFFVMPQATPTMEAGTIASWNKAEGDSLAVGDVLAVVETDKAAMDIETFDKGVLLKLLAAEGDEIPAGFPIAIIGAAGEDVSALVAQFSTMTPAAATPEAAPPEPAAVPEPTGSPALAAPAASAPPPAAAGWTAPTWNEQDLDPSIMESSGRFAVEGPVVRASPVARKLAADKGIDLTSIQGSGPMGRIVKADVESAGGRSSGGLGSTAVVRGADQDVRNSKMRKVIASRLKESYLDAPVFFLTASLDCDRLVDFRAQLKVQDVQVSYNDLVVKAVALALRDHPDCNASWSEQHITRFGSVDVGIAVALPGGLITPIVRNADQKGLSALASETRELVGRARDRKLAPEEYTGATFSVSNLGMMQIEEFTALINPPGSGILAIGSMQQEPVVVSGQLAVGWRMKVTMTCDHRVIDGALGAEFLLSVRKYIENPLLMVV
jgi:pyruvate dehydrogenase E2 component (dihydrolipoamide acetyltransferase)